MEINRLAECLQSNMINEIRSVNDAVLGRNMSQKIPSSAGRRSDLNSDAFNVII